MQEVGAAPRNAAARWLRGALTALVSLVMFAMMMVITIDVTGRAFFNFPIKGSDEIVSFLLVALIFGSLPLVTWDQHHITVTLFGRWIHGWLERALSVAIAAVCTIIVAVIAYRMWIQADLMAEGQHQTGALQWPIAPIVYTASLLSALAAAVLAMLTWQKLIGREPPTVPIDEEAEPD